MKLYNTLTRKKEEFTPIVNKEVKMYTCGLTVYSQPQIGNWVAYIYSDVLTRTLIASGYNVTRVQNITDVGHLTSDEDAGEDKMLKGALKEGSTAWEAAEKYIKIADHEAFDILRLLRPSSMPRATEYIDQQIEMVKQLEEHGYTYKIQDGVYFDTSKLNDYGKLAKLDIKGLQFGARVADTGKKNPTDFAVWKFSNPNEKRDMEWESPWGVGFPGWHLECSVMARELLGDQIDIHTGGIDHIPVHHTNEIAQIESITKKLFSRFWFHNNHMKVNGTKLSKSLGNSYTLDDLSQKGFTASAFKLLVLSSHYRTEGNFTWEILEAAKNRLAHWQAAADLRWQAQELEDQESQAQNQIVITARQNLLLSLQDDLDTPHALSIIDEVVNHLEKTGLSESNEKSFNDFLSEVDKLLGINLIHPDITTEQKALISDRQAARKTNDWDKSDSLRDELSASGLEVRDTPSGTIWSRIQIQS